MQEVPLCQTDYMQARHSWRVKSACLALKQNCLHTEDVWLRCRSALQRAQPGNTDQEGRVLDTHEVARVLELVLGAIESRLSAEALDVLDVPFLLQHLECVGVARLVERVMYNLLQDQQQQQAVHPLPGCASSTPEEQQQQQQPKRVPSMQPHELVQGLLLCAARHLACTPCSRTGCAVDLLQVRYIKDANIREQGSTDGEGSEIRHTWRCACARVDVPPAAAERQPEDAPGGHQGPTQPPPLPMLPAPCLAVQAHVHAAQGLGAPPQ
eukprot:1103808-Pelagomonas_calceolata.AAC.5